MKQCQYNCRADDGRQSYVNGPGKDLAKGDVCYGAKYHDQYVNYVQDFTNMTDSLEPFNVDTESFWDNFHYPDELIDSINNAFPNKNNSR